ncbi:MAG: SHOCT domain-containing protein [Phycisphaerales bacterium]|jgi:hypothetical protein|nr:SHOCT domain-containing protein [Phycisphaerales bacterium]
MIESVLAVAEVASDQSKDFSRIIGPLLIMGGIVLAAWCTLVVIRRKLRSNENGHGEAFTLSELRLLRDSGQITEEEFNLAKAAMLEAAGRPPSQS